MMKTKDRGFTLIELMIVVAIIGILAAVAIPKFADLIDKAKEASTKGKLGAIRSALSIYYGSYEGLAPLGTALETALVTDGDNLSAMPSGDVPTGNHDWVAGTNASSGAYSSKGTSDMQGTVNSGKSYYYDSTDLEIWIDCTHTDKAAIGIHTW